MNLVSVDNWQGNLDFELISEPIECTKLKHPITIDPIKEVFDKVCEKPPKSSRLFLASFYDVIVSNGKIMDKQLQNEVEEFSKCGGMSLNCGPKIIDVGVHLADMWGGSNYWHWMSTCLARMSLLNVIPRKAKLIINSLDKRFVRESLVEMGMNLSDCIEIDKDGPLQCNELIAPSRIGDRDDIGVKHLRELLRPDIIKRSRRVFISRNSSRRITNEKSVMDYLGKLGFEKVKCEKLSFEEQVNIFSDASVVIAPHGAGLTNLIFAKDNVKVLELRSPYYFGSCYWKLCNHLDFEYYSLYGEGRIPKTTEELNTNIHADITIDIDKLERTLKLMGIR